MITLSSKETTCLTFLIPFFFYNEINSIHSSIHKVQGENYPYFCFYRLVLFFEPFLID